jgi:hypothetical protein
MFGPLARQGRVASLAAVGQVEVCSVCWRTGKGLLTWLVQGKCRFAHLAGVGQVEVYSPACCRAGKGMLTSLLLGR